MKKKQIGVVVLALLTIAALGFAQGNKGKQAGSSKAKAVAAHVIVTPDEVKWGPMPPSLPPGAQFAVIDGDPGKAGALYTVRIKAPDGYKIPPHWHPVDEIVTVLEGTLAAGLGDKFDETAGHDLTAGSYARMPTGLRHFAWTKGETTIQVHGIGPFAITYVNPADDPRHKAK